MNEKPASANKEYEAAMKKWRKSHGIAEPEREPIPNLPPSPQEWEAMKSRVAELERRNRKLERWPPDLRLENESLRERVAELERENRSLKTTLRKASVAINKSPKPFEIEALREQLERVKQAVEIGADEGPVYCPKPECVVAEIKAILAKIEEENK